MKGFNIQGKSIMAEKRESSAGVNSKTSLRKYCFANLETESTPSAKLTKRIKAVSTFSFGESSSPTFFPEVKEVDDAGEEDDDDDDDEIEDKESLDFFVMFGV
jgi:hypothetical protein